MSESAPRLAGVRPRPVSQELPGPPVQWQESEARTRYVHIQLEEYFAGKRRDFDLKLDLRGTGFRKLCWDHLIPGFSLRPDEILRGDRQGCGLPSRVSRGRPGQSLRPCRHRRALPSGFGRRQATGGYVRRLAYQGLAARAGGGPGFAKSRRLRRLQSNWASIRKRPPKPQHPTFKSTVKRERFRSSPGWPPATCGYKRVPVRS